MAKIVDTDIKLYKSSKSPSIGGAITVTEIVDATSENLFDNVKGTESRDGDTEYRCFYIQNKNGTNTYIGAEIYISATDSPDTDVSVGLGSSGLNGIEQEVTDESTSPTSVTFTQPTSGSPLVIGDMGPDEFIPVWVRRVVTAGASAYNNDGFTLTIDGDTSA